MKENTFASACFEQNSIEELIGALSSKSADKADCKEWGITPTQWRESIKLALLERVKGK